MRHAMDDKLILAIEQVFSTIPDGIKCAVSYADGKHFSARLNLSELKERDIIEGLNRFRMCPPALEKAQLGIVAAMAVIHGDCVGSSAYSRG